MGSNLNELYNYLIDIINNSTIYGPLFAGFLILVESILPILPLFVFITILFIAYGPIIGFLISYALTCLGCALSFFFFRFLLKNFFEKRIRKNERINKAMRLMDKIKISNLVLLIAIPFTPAFLINIAAGLSRINFKHYFISILIGKVSLVAFWGFIGTSLLESLKNPKILIILFFMLLASYLASKYVTRKLKIE
jgi:uncharacterized membrane protein YdjX (TVP38/TMEM64 family)